MIEIDLNTEPSPDRLALRFEARREGDCVDAVVHVAQPPVVLDYQFSTDARELLEWISELERLHESLAGVVVFPKNGPPHVSIAVDDRHRGRLDISASLPLQNPSPAVFAGFATDPSFLPHHVASLRSFLSLTGKARRLEVVEVDLGGVVSSAQMHVAFSEALGFPDFYGHNLDAFHDAVTGLVVMPRTLVLRGWAQLQQRLPREASVVQEVLRSAVGAQGDPVDIVLA